MLEAKDVSVALSGRTIVREASLVARPGTLSVVIGPNGSGKTTLFRALCGDIAHTGTIHLHGELVRHLNPMALAARRAVLPQASALGFPFTVREVVAIGASTGHAGVPLDRLDDLPELALDKVDLAGFGGRFYGELSGGEQQRVQLARVLCQAWVPVLDGRSRLLLMDEPISSLDIRHQLTVMEVARDYADRGGTVLCILHDLNIAALYADSVHAVSSGRIVRSGRPAEVIDEALMHDVFGSRLPVRHSADGGVTVVPQRPARG